ncbi:flavin reductase (NADPH)-like [Hoplias malabaricus]|uniref:flavin reductase (NADPH)-like n=1 Tax=Hoplias malabaricus TaxID=27720 RepID=UPI003462DC42
MKIAVLGATGQTGQQLVSQALQHGHIVTAIVRNPGKLTITHDNLKVVEGSIFSEESLKPHFKDQDAVMSCLGFPPAPLVGVTGYTESMTATLNAMREVRVNRIVTMTSWYTEPNSGANCSFFIRYMLLPMIRSVLTNMYAMEQLLKETDDIEWTVVRPPGLQNTPVTEKEYLTHEGYYVPDENDVPVGQAVSRADVARFMLSVLSSNSWIKKAVAIITK